MIPASALISAAPKYLGRAYDDMDCQAYVEKVMADVGIRMNLPGSNAWWRYALQHGWAGTPEKCVKEFGRIPKGAFLFILKNDGKEPAKYLEDGRGNASHIGLYTGMSQDEMLEAAFAAQGITDDKDKQNNLIKKAAHGSGAINSSYSWGCVATSKFSGKSIEGGWNRVWLWTNMIDYKEKRKKPMSKAKVVLPSGKSGNTVNLRKDISTSSPIIAKVPVGSTVEVYDDYSDWCSINYSGNMGYMMSNYLEYEGQADETDSQQLSENERATIDGALKSIENACNIIGGIVGRG